MADFVDTRTPEECDRDEAINAVIEGLLDRVLAALASAPNMPEGMQPVDHLLSATATIASRLSAATSYRVLSMERGRAWQEQALNVAMQFAYEAGDTIRPLDGAAKLAAVLALQAQLARGAAGGRR